MIIQYPKTPSSTLIHFGHKYGIIGTYILINNLYFSDTNNNYLYNFGGRGTHVDGYIYIYIHRYLLNRFSLVMRCFVSFFFIGRGYQKRCDGGGGGSTGCVVVHIVENANGAFSLWRPFRVDIFAARFTKKETLTSSQRTEKKKKKKSSA